MNIDTSKRRRAVIVAIAALGLVGAGGVAVTGDASAVRSEETRVDDARAPYETVALPGTSETYVDMREDGSYYDPSLGRRVSPRPPWPYETGAVAGTSETYVDMQGDGSYYDPSLGRRVSPAG